MLRVPVRASAADQGRTAARLSVVREQLARRGPELPTTLALVQWGDMPKGDQWWKEALQTPAAGARTLGTSAGSKLDSPPPIWLSAGPYISKKHYR